MSSNSKTMSANDELRCDYDFESMMAKPNRFSGQLRESVRYVPLDPDVAAFYSSTKELNDFLRAMIPLLQKRDEAKV